MLTNENLLDRPSKVLDKSFRNLCVPPYQYNFSQSRYAIMRLTGNFSFPRPERSDRSDRIFSACMLIFTLIILTILASHRLQAKKPGERHCYRDVCVTVLSIKEVKDILGKTVKLKASYYDDPSVDRFNANELTSNGERFSADDPTRTASSNFPDGTELLLRNPRNGLVSHVRVNDFGPFWGNRELDVTRRVAEDLGCLLYTSPSPRDA